MWEQKEIKWGKKRALRQSDRFSSKPHISQIWAAVSQEEEQVGHQSQGSWFNPQLVLSKGQSVLEQDTDPILLPMGRTVQWGIICNISGVLTFLPPM